MIAARDPLSTLNIERLELDGRGGLGRHGSLLNLGFCYGQAVVPTADFSPLAELGPAHRGSL